MYIFTSMNTPALTVFNYSVKNQSDNTVDIHVDGYFVDSPSLEMSRNYWGDETSVSYKSFRDSIPADVKTINLKINSGGGHVGDAMAIHDFLAELEDKGVTVNREGRGIVASAATYPLMGKNSSLSANCLLMIHEVSGYAYGDVSTMENQVKALRKFNNLIVDFYVRETGLSKKEVENMMKAETWMNATEAKDYGFVKNTGPKADITNQIPKEKWPFQNTAILNTYTNFFTPKNTPEMDITKIQEAIQNGFNSLAEKLGLKEKTNDETVKNAFTEFSQSITNALADVKPTDEKALQDLVTNAVTEAMKNVGENDSIKQAVANHLKELPENFTKAITEATKNTVTKDDLSTEMKNLTKAITDKMGGKSKDDEEDDKPKNKKVIKNRFANSYDDYYSN